MSVNETLEDLLPNCTTHLQADRKNAMDRTEQIEPNQSSQANVGLSKTVYDISCCL